MLKWKYSWFWPAARSLTSSCLYSNSAGFVRTQVQVEMTGIVETEPLTSVTYQLIYIYIYTPPELCKTTRSRSHKSCSSKGTFILLRKQSMHPYSIWSLLNNITGPSINKISIWYNNKYHTHGSNTTQPIRHKLKGPAHMTIWRGYGRARFASFDDHFVYFLPLLTVSVSTLASPMISLKRSTWTMVSSRHHLTCRYLCQSCFSALLCSQAYIHSSHWCNQNRQEISPAAYLAEKLVDFLQSFKLDRMTIS